MVTRFQNHHFRENEFSSFSSFVKEIFENEVLSEVVKKDSLLEVVHTQGPWYKDFNHFVEKYKNDTKYFLMTHDDLTLNTANYYNRAMKEIEGHEDEIGWIVWST